MEVLGLIKLTESEASLIGTGNSLNITVVLSYSRTLDDILLYVKPINQLTAQREIIRLWSEYKDLEHFQCQSAHEVNIS